MLCLIYRYEYAFVHDRYIGTFGHSRFPWKSENHSYLMNSQLVIILLLWFVIINLDLIIKVPIDFTNKNLNSLTKRLFICMVKWYIKFY